jgi:putative oxidoreductase
MASHGWGKFQMLLAGESENFADPIGVGKWLSLVLAVFAEFVCALLVVVGLGTRLAAIPVAITMAVAAFVVHANDPLTMGQQGGSKEPALLFLIPFVTLFFTGAGKLSMDGLIVPRWRERRRQRAAGVP